jgi:hypothetical protein
MAATAVRLGSPGPMQEIEIKISFDTCLNLEFQCSTSLNLTQLFSQMENQSYQTMADRRLVGLVASYCCLPQCPFYTISYRLI